MSSNKYADLPDIDTAPDIYETEDVFPSAQSTVGKFFCILFAYSLALFLRKNELVALESELADPSNPLLAKEREADNIDPGELIRGLVDVRGRLDKIRKGKEGRARLVDAVLGEDKETAVNDEDTEEKKGADAVRDKGKPEARTIVEMDQRVGELEKLVGSSTAALDETSPLTPPLLPLITRLNAQLSLLTQPRHIDSISRRLKLLLSDLDRASAQHSHRRHPSQPNAAPQTSQIQEQVLPLLSRLSPSLPQIPHILTRLRTLAALHTSAAEFQDTLQSLEQEQQKIHEALTEFESAVTTVETSLDENRDVVKGNVAGLEGRVDSLLSRLEELNRPGTNSNS
ncbi:hypothetical protein DXG03_003881 [Asterophora parasitica]|uniref:Uncharacterized protein n=1 Tax=Asterophora parasitica TaxID=117018 RepID=A0A9P7GFC2_9AGAR|nr:hypothetical protein DXG03_003881 [Asterophora parasitica]